MIAVSPNPFMLRINVQLNSIIYIIGNPPHEAGFLFRYRLLLTGVPYLKNGTAGW